MYIYTHTHMYRYRGIFGDSYIPLAGPSGVGLRPLTYCNRGFESHRGHRCLSCVLSGRGLCDELITCPEETCRLWCIIVCDKTSWYEEAIAHAGLQSQKKKVIIHYMNPTMWIACLITKQKNCSSHVWVRVQLPHTLFVHVKCLHCPSFVCLWCGC
jgi:hypothetical protein